MEKVSNLLGGTNMVRDMVAVEGTCEKHGTSTAHILPRHTPGWFCDQCRTEKLKLETQARWLAERAEHLHKVACIPPKYHGQRFDAKTPEQRAARGTVKAFNDALVGGDKWAVLVLMGGIGTGKTKMASELGESIINNRSMSVRYCTARQMISEIQASYKQEGKSEESEVSRFVDYDLLIVDEIDAKPDRENANQLMNEVVNRRYNLDRPMVIITNQSFESLGAFVGDRANDRFQENAYVAAFTWPSFRSGIK